MRIEQDEIFERSKPETVTGGSSFDFDLSFLNHLRASMDAPCVRQLVLHLSGTVSADGGDTLGEDAWKIVQNATVSDRHGALFDQVPGSLLRLEAQRYHGGAAFDPAGITSAGTNSAFNLWVPFDFEIPEKFAHRPADTRLPLIHLTDGGRFNVRFQAPTNYTLDSVTARLYARVIDERTRELKSRRVVRTFTIAQTEDVYVFNGSLQRAVIASDLGTSAGYTALSLATFDSLDSRDLKFPSGFSTQLLLQRYREVMAGFAASDDEVLASTPNAIELHGPHNGQRMGRMPSLRQLHLKGLASVPTSGRLLMSYIEDRAGGLAAEWMRMGSVPELVDAISKSGTVPIQGGGVRDVTAWPPDLVRRLPIRI